MGLEKIQIGDKFHVEIDPANLNFSEGTLTKYLQEESGWYDYFGSFLAIAEKYLGLKECQYDKMFGDKFSFFKDEEKASDKLAEFKTKADPDLVYLKEQIIDAKYIVKRLTQHIRAWDKNHDNAQSLGHIMRKEMDKLNATSLFKNNNNELEGL